jgi:hypothetical protein
MTLFSASEVQFLIAMVQNRRILRRKSSRIIGNKQKLLVPRSGDALAQRIGGGLQAVDIINVTNVTVDTPFLIWAQPSNMLVASHIQPADSTAQIDYVVDSDTLEGVETVT